MKEKKHPMLKSYQDYYKKTNKMEEYFRDYISKVVKTMGEKIGDDTYSLKVKGIQLLSKSPKSICTEIELHNGVVSHKDKDGMYLYCGNITISDLWRFIEELNEQIKEEF